jgi:hypothetical protein
MTYFVEQEIHGRKQVEFDYARFLADLVKAFGGQNVDPQYQGGRFEVEGLTITIRTGSGAKARRVTLAASAADTRATRMAYAQGTLPRFPKITIDPDRPFDTLVRDIRKRVIDAGAAPLASLKALAGAQETASDALRQHAERLNAAFPGAVTVPDDRTKDTASVYLNKGVYLSGRLTSSGTLHIDRIGSLSGDKVERLLALLVE